MSARDTRSTRDDPRTLPISRALVLVRAACADAVTRPALVRDLAPLVAHELPLADWRARAQTELAALRRDKLVGERRGRLSATPLGKTAVDDVLGQALPVALDWPAQRDVRLFAKALGVAEENAEAYKALGRPGAARAVVLQKAFGLPIKANESITKLRARLAVAALERAFGDKIKSGFGQGAGLPAKAGRLLAGHLSRSPRDFGSDGRLIAALAAEQAGTDETDEAALRLVVIRAFVSRSLAEERAADARPAETLGEPARPDAPATAAPPRATPASRPDLPGFVSEVHAAARRAAEGWPAKAYISRVWREVRGAAPQWALSEIEFKCMLAEAHRAGHIVLAGADLKDKRFQQELHDSAVTYKNTVWHFVRVP